MRTRTQWLLFAIRVRARLCVMRRHSGKIYGRAAMLMMAECTDMKGWAEHIYIFVHANRSRFEYNTALARIKNMAWVCGLCLCMCVCVFEMCIRAQIRFQI